MKHQDRPAVFGMMAEFDSAQALVDATQAAVRAGWTKMDAYSPFPIHGLAESMGFRRTWVPQLVLGAGIIGGLAGFGMQYFAYVLHYPMIIGGKPLNSWPAWIPITFELTILFAAFTAVFGMLALNGFPQPYHPVFNVDSFGAASRDKFFLCLESSDPKFESAGAREFLRSLNPIEVNDVPW